MQLTGFAMPVFLAEGMAAYGAYTESGAAREKLNKKDRKRNYNGVAEKIL